MASSGQKRGGCGHVMAGFDTHSYCARCCDKGNGPDPCVEKPGNVKSPCSSAPAYKRKKVEKEKDSTSKSVKPTDKPAKSSTENRLVKASTDARIDELDQKWSDPYNRLEALLLAKTRPTTGTDLADYQGGSYSLQQLHSQVHRTLHQAGQPTSSSVYRTVYQQILLSLT